MKTDINYSDEELQQLDEIVEKLKNGLSLHCQQYNYDQKLYRILVTENLVTSWDNTNGITTIEAKTGSPIMLDPSWTFSKAYHKAKVEKVRSLSPTYIDNSQTTIIGNNNKIKDKKHTQQGSTEIEKRSVWNKLIDAIPSLFKFN